jgi:hypothetical protein
MSKSQAVISILQKMIGPMVFQYYTKCLVHLIFNFNTVDSKIFCSNNNNNNNNNNVYRLDQFGFQLEREQSHCSLNSIYG